MDINLLQTGQRGTGVGAGIPLQVEFVADISCPFCFLGKRRLDAALKSLQGGAGAEFRWQPFQLNPDIPTEGLELDTYLARRFGSRSAVDPVLDRITTLGTEVGIDFDFGRIARMPNTLDAHRLLLMAEDSGEQGELADSLFCAFFENGLDIGRRDVLVELAARYGFDRLKATRYLASDESVLAAQAIESNYRQMGVDAVPNYIFNGRIAVSGVQDLDTLITALDFAVFPKPDVTHEGEPLH